MRRPWSVLAALSALAVVAVVLAGLALWRVRTPPAEAVAAIPMGTPAAATMEQTPSPNAGRPAPAATVTPSRSASPGARATPMSGGTMVVIGDGYAAEASWPDSVAAEFGMRVHNMAQGGMGYQTAPRWCDVAPCASIRGSVTKIVASAPSLVVLAAGEADGDQELAESATATLDQLREALPTATIVVMSPTTDRATTPAWLERHAEQLKEAASESGATWLDVTPITSGSAAFEAGSLTPRANGQVAAALERALR